jgi:hypothetical protein
MTIPTTSIIFSAGMVCCRTDFELCLPPLATFRTLDRSCDGPAALRSGGRQQLRQAGLDSTNTSI